MTHRIAVLAVVACAALAGACSASGSASQAAAPGSPARAPTAAGTVAATPTTSSGSTPSASAEPALTPIPDASQAPDSGNGGAAGDVPDNAVFLTYQSAAWQFAIQYVEGWQVTTQPNGVLIRDKDSSETVTVAQLPGDVSAWIASTDLPSLRSQPGFSLVKQNAVRVGPSTYNHLVYHVKSPPDPVTGKQVPSTVDRFYIPGPGLAVISLATPDGVDNVDAFRQIIGSFSWKAR